MCWKYEELYGVCYDDAVAYWGLELNIVGNAEHSTHSIIQFWADEWNLEVIPEKEDEFRTKLYDFLSTLHEEGIIRPKTDPKGMIK